MRKLGYQDSNLDQLNQNQPCCRITPYPTVIPHCLKKKILLRKFPRRALRVALNIADRPGAPWHFLLDQTRKAQASDTDGRAVGLGLTWCSEGERHAGCLPAPASYPWEGAIRWGSGALKLPDVDPELPGVSLGLLGLVMRLLSLILSLLRLLRGLIRPFLGALSPLVCLLGIILRLLQLVLRLLGLALGLLSPLIGLLGLTLGLLGLVLRLLQLGLGLLRLALGLLGLVQRLPEPGFLRLPRSTAGRAMGQPT